MTISLIKNCSLRVSSVLNKSKEYGKQNMIDDSDDTSWNSDQGSPQWVQLDFKNSVKIQELHIQFQGGFSGKECWVEIRKNGSMHKLQSIYPEDSNSLQVFILEPNCTESIKVVFNSSTDFYGRIIIYKLDVKGSTEME